MVNSRNFKRIKIKETIPSINIPIKKTKEEKEDDEFFDSLLNEKCPFHDWHLAKYFENPFSLGQYSTWVCSKCGKTKQLCNSNQ